jgi:hypothetical protein
MHNNIKAGWQAFCFLLSSLALLIARISTVSKPDVQTPVWTTPAPPLLKRCPRQCVKTSLANICQPGTLDFGQTTCSVSEVCCEVIEMTTKLVPVKPCQFTCVNSSSASLCDFEALAKHLLNDTDVGACPHGQQCCPTRKTAICPPSHVCLPTGSGNLCEPGSIIDSHDLDDCRAATRICCILDVTRGQEIKPTLATAGTVTKCDGACLSGLDADLCLLAQSAVSGFCPSGQLCCKLGEASDVSALLRSKNDAADVIVPAGVVNASLSSIPPLPCDGHGECLATYLATFCEAKEGGRTFSDLFFCASPKRRCCVPKSVVDQRKSTVNGPAGKFTVYCKIKSP